MRSLYQIAFNLHHFFFFFFFFVIEWTSFVRTHTVLTCMYSCAKSINTFVNIRVLSSILLASRTSSQFWSWKWLRNWLWSSVSEEKVLLPMNMMFVFCVTEEQPKEHCGHYEMTARHRYALLVRASCDDQVKTRASGFCYSSGRVYQLVQLIQM